MTCCILISFFKRLFVSLSNPKLFTFFHKFHGYVKHLGEGCIWQLTVFLEMELSKAQSVFCCTPNYSRPIVVEMAVFLLPQFCHT